tara:strand:+ start:327 stop:791 length:465 start_codon:yes stop_codon:yes gene_type:complete
MAWDKWHKTYNYTTGSVTMTPGYLSETITLGDDADASTSYLPISINSDATILAIFSRDIGTDTYIQVEHSVDGSTWVKMGEFEEDPSVDHDDISKNMAKIAAIDASIMDSLTGGMMMLYDIDTHGASPYMRFTVKANGTDESNTDCTFHFIPHF